MADEIQPTPKQKAERRDEATRPGFYFQPAVDILENPNEIVVLADMPGVPPDGVEVDVEGDELRIEGRVRPEDYEGLKPLHVEYNVGGFYRRFTLGEQIDRDRIEAQLKDGVLVLKLPKAEHTRPRKVAVRAAS